MIEREQTVVYAIEQTLVVSHAVCLAAIVVKVHDRVHYVYATLGHHILHIDRYGISLVGEIIHAQMLQHPVQGIGIAHIHSRYIEVSTLREVVCRLYAECAIRSLGIIWQRLHLRVEHIILQLLHGQAPGAFSLALQPEHSAHAQRVYDLLRYADLDRLILVLIDAALPESVVLPI